MKGKILLTISILLISNLKSDGNGFNFSGFIIPDGEQLFMESKNPYNREPGIGVNTVTEIIEYGKSIYLVEEGDNTVIKMHKNDLRPILYHKMDEKGNTVKKIEYSGTKAHVIIPQKQINKVVDIEPNTYDQYTLIYLFRALPFDDIGKAINFSFIFESTHRIQIIKSVVKILGEEEITVPAGIYSCYKVEFGFAGIIGIFAPDKFTYYFTKNPPHHFVKYADPKRGEYIELLKCQIIKK